jgi:ATP-dependent Lon protease
LGGELLQVEVSVVQGSGKLELTGNLGDVMKESARAAVSYIRKHSGELSIDPEFYTKQDVHIHVPEGAVPKDGPSAGITLCTALVSELTGKTVKRNVAMTGEITLTGRVLPIGGLREKTMAAYKYGCDTVIIPYDNSGDIDDLDKEVRVHLNVIPVKNISEVLHLAVNP